MVRTAQVIGRNLTLLDDQSLLLAQWLERGSYGQCAKRAQCRGFEPRIGEVVLIEPGLNAPTPPHHPTHLPALTAPQETARCLHGAFWPPASWASCGTDLSRTSLLSRCHAGTGAAAGTGYRKKNKNKRKYPRCESNAQSPDPESDALSIRPRGRTEVKHGEIHASCTTRTLPCNPGAGVLARSQTPLLLSSAPNHSSAPPPSIPPP